MTKDNQKTFAELQAQNEELSDLAEEMTFLLNGLKVEVEESHRSLDAEDLLGRFKAEIVAPMRRAQATQRENDSLMRFNSDLKGELKSALRRTKRLEGAR